MFRLSVRNCCPKFVQTEIIKRPKFWRPMWCGVMTAIGLQSVTTDCIVVYSYIKQSYLTGESLHSKRFRTLIRNESLDSNLRSWDKMSSDVWFGLIVYTVRDIPNRICKTASIRFRKRNFKRCSGIIPFHSNMQNAAILRCCFSVTCYKQRRWNEQRIMTHAYTAIVLVAFAVRLCSISVKTAK